MGEFEKWFINQDFYTNMRFIHGDNLFSKDADVYRVLPVQMTFVAWNKGGSKIEQLEKERLELESKYRVLHALGRMRAAVITAEKWSVLRPHIKKAIKCLDRKEKALRGEHE